MKMYAILRNDIYMDVGKAAAQAGHAFEHTILKAINLCPERVELYHPGGRLGTKVVLGAPLGELTYLTKVFRRLYIPYYLVIDSGHIFPPDFNGQRITTALGVGPLLQEESDKWLSHLELFSTKKIRRK